jgi:RNA polymerase sigma factor (sigma-70 family)
VTFEELYAEQRLPVFRTIRGIVDDIATAEDLTQETFAKAYRHQLEHGAAESPGAWLHRIAVNTAISYVRRQNHERRLPVRLGLVAPAAAFEHVEDRMLVDRALARLTPKLREAVVLQFFAGLTREQIAARLGVPPGTVGSRQAAALAAMWSTVKGGRRCATT